MKVIKPPALDEDYDPINLEVFLAGSIEMGLADDWQLKLSEMLKEVPNLILYNPRRDEWDSSWEQSIKHEKFYEQVNWELDHLLNSNLAVFYFDPSTRSPITLMELGLAAAEGVTCLVLCPEGFWRKGNVDIVCHRYSNNVQQFESFEEIVSEIIKYVISHEQYMRMSGYKKGRRFDEVDA